jgi:hypothetical protein
MAETAVNVGPSQGVLMPKAGRRADPRPRAASLSREAAVFEAHVSRWVVNHEGEHVLIKGEEVVGFYDSRDAALTEGYSRFGVGPLFVKQILPSEPVHHIPNALL